VGVLSGELSPLVLWCLLSSRQPRRMIPDVVENTGSAGPINTISATTLAEGQISAAVRRCAPC
jgi:hypothetical protein